MGRRDAWTGSSGFARSQSFGDERSTMVMGEITAPRSWPRTESPDPDAFGDYKIHEQLGVGGMATVHRAERKVGGVRQRVALKRLLPNIGSDPELVKLFLDEAKLVSHLHHRNIAEIYDFGSVADEYFLAMELVAGPTLKQLLQHSSSTVGLIPYPIALNLLMQVCDALAYAHDRTDERGQPLHLVHRDVSPSNIVISSNGVVKLIDFGVAKTTSSHTQAGIIKGKLGYIAPEYLADNGLDRRADLWAVGVIAYELLCNQRLFQADDDFEVMRHVRSQPITPPSRHNPDMPIELEAIVMTALERDPARRWQNASALRNALAGVGGASTNAEVMEWVDWALQLGAGKLRPVRGSRPLTAQADMLAAEPLIPALSDAVQLSLPPTVKLQQCAIPAIRLPLPANPTPPPVFAPRVRYQPRPLMPRMPPIGAAMIARRNQRRIALPLFLILLGGIASALTVPMLYRMLVAQLGL
ncbi:MAG TPA: serine/threonine-protein kinase [Kofleriaceae bacterium]